MSKKLTPVFHPYYITHPDGTETVHPSVVLNSGSFRVVNFSSPHLFAFETGEVLDRCPDETANYLKLDSVEQITRHPLIPDVEDIELQFRMSPPVRRALEVLEANAQIQVILVPLPVLSAMKAAGMHVGKARVCRVADRVAKTIYANRYCR